MALASAVHTHGLAAKLGTDTHLPPFVGRVVETLAGSLVGLRPIAARRPSKVEKPFHLGMFHYHSAVYRHIHEIIREEPVLLVEVGRMVAVPQREDDAGVQATLRVGGNHGVELARHALKRAMLLDIVQQIDPEVIQAKIHDGDGGWKDSGFPRGRARICVY